MHIYIYIYIYICVCVCVCVYKLPLCDVILQPSSTASKLQITIYRMGTNTNECICVRQ